MWAYDCQNKYPIYIYATASAYDKTSFQHCDPTYTSIMYTSKGKN